MNDSSARSRRNDLVVPLLLMGDGLVGVSMAVFANVLGIDPSPGWGSSRLFILIGGAALIVTGAIRLITRKPLPFLGPIEKTESARMFFLLVHIWLVILAVYAWFATYGTFSAWNRTSRYFDRLAASFQQGRLDIDIDPGAAFLRSPNPYDPKTRAPFSDEIWDMSFYDGKLYYYWGPFPALAIVPIRALFHGRVTDLSIAFFFTAGLLVFNTLIILKLRRLFFPWAGTQSVVLAVFVTGLVLPILWNMSTPYVYAAAVCAGAFSMMGGIYFTIAGLQDSPTLHRGKLFLAGTFFAYAVGSRALQALSVILVSLLVLLWVGQSIPASSRRGGLVTALLAFFAPLAIGALLIGWYNWARFDSPFEFGLQYQITTYDLTRQNELIFQSAYLPLNLRAYLLQPFAWVDQFPFIVPVAFPVTLTTPGITQPLYYSGRVTGILYSAPFFVLGLAAAVTPLGRIQQKADIPAQQQQFHRFVIALLGGTFLIGFASILFYFNAQTRFLTDTAPQIALLAIIGYWSVLKIGRSLHPVWAGSLSLLMNTLALTNILAGLLLAVTGETDRLETFNPGLLESIRALLRF